MPDQPTQRERDLEAAYAAQVELVRRYMMQLVIAERALVHYAARDGEQSRASAALEAMRRVR